MAGLGAIAVVAAFGSIAEIVVSDHDPMCVEYTNHFQVGPSESFASVEIAGFEVTFHIIRGAGVEPDVAVLLPWPSALMPDRFMAALFESQKASFCFTLLATG